MCRCVPAESQIECASQQIAQLPVLEMTAHRGRGIFMGVSSRLWADTGSFGISGRQLWARRSLVAQSRMPDWRQVPQS